MIPEVFVTPSGTLTSDATPDGDAREDIGAALLHLATAGLQATLLPSLSFARAIGRRYLMRLCHVTGLEERGLPEPVEPPSQEELEALALQAPPMKGLEYLGPETLRSAWHALDEHVHREIAASGDSAAAWLHAHAPQWRTVGRVVLHLAENKHDEDQPFAFLASYASRLSDRGVVQHLPLARALQDYAGAANRQRLVALLSPVESAAEQLPWVRELVESGELYQALAWTPAEAHRFLRDIPTLEAAGLIVRVPDWWQAQRPPRPQVRVRVGERTPAGLGADALLDFSVELALEGAPLTAREKSALLSSGGGLVRLRGRWVEVDREQLAAALAHWQQVARAARTDGISFFEGMRLLAGAGGAGSAAPEAETPLRAWTGIESGRWLTDLMARLREPGAAANAPPRDLHATLRPYQQSGVAWLRLVTGLGLGACLADDMGLGKTVQVLALLLHLKTEARSRKAAAAPPSVVVAPASLIANWKAEAERFAPSLRLLVAHPSESELDLDDEAALASALAGTDLVITTYGVLARSDALRRQRWRLAILDEAQAIRNAATRQARAARELQADGRLALTGTPIENRAGDLWSLFEFLNPGLLGSAQAFTRVVKRAAREQDGFASLRRLVQPYILRRLKTDPRVITDLPAKTEVRAWCSLSREQAALYEAAVRSLAERLARSDGMQRRGLVLSTLMQLKQICNHPAQWRGEGDFAVERSGKLERLAEIGAEIGARQRKALIFTQFREITSPLADALRDVFGAPGLVLHGGTPVAERRRMVEAFQREDGPPFFVLSLKAGGTGLNLTAASHVVHFDRWWNPAVENQATDRAFRIGQQRNVLVHKFVCRGTVEEKIDALIEAKVGLARDLLDQGGEILLTEMSDRELLDLMALDIHKACDT